MIVEVPVQVAKEIFDGILDIPQELPSERAGVQFADVPVPHVMIEILERFMDR